jgi:hypothetical protein
MVKQSVECSFNEINQQIAREASTGTVVQNQNRETLSNLKPSENIADNS